MKKAYLDANILLAIPAGSRKEPSRFKLAVKVLDEIKHGRIVGVVSSLTLMEVLAVLRTQKGKERPRLERLPVEDRLEFVLNESKSMYDRLITELMKMSNLKFELGKACRSKQCNGTSL